MNFWLNSQVLILIILDERIAVYIFPCLLHEDLLDIILKKQKNVNIKEPEE